MDLKACLWLNMLNFSVAIQNQLISSTHFYIKYHDVQLLTIIVFGIKSFFFVICSFF